MKKIIAGLIVLSFGFMNTLPVIAASKVEKAQIETVKTGKNVKKQTRAEKGAQKRAEKEAKKIMSNYKTTVSIPSICFESRFFGGD